MSSDQVLGWTATILFTVCYVPQIIKTWRTGTVDGVSKAMFLIQFAANVVALEYAIMIEQPALIVKYVFGIAFVGIATVIIVGVGYRRHIMPSRSAWRRSGSHG